MEMQHASLSRLGSVFSDRMRKATPLELQLMFQRGVLMQSQYLQQMFIWAAKVVARDSEGLGREDELSIVIADIPECCWIPLQKDFLRANGFLDPPDRVIVLFKNGEISEVRFREFLWREAQKNAIFVRNEKDRMAREGNDLDLRKELPAYTAIKGLGLAFWSADEDRTFLIENGFLNPSN